MGSLFLGDSAHTCTGDAAPCAAAGLRCRTWSSCSPSDRDLRRSAPDHRRARGEGATPPTRKATLHGALRPPPARTSPRAMCVGSMTVEIREGRGSGAQGHIFLHLDISTRDPHERRRAFPRRQDLRRRRRHQGPIRCADGALHMGGVRLVPCRVLTKKGEETTPCCRPDAIGEAACVSCTRQPAGLELADRLVASAPRTALRRAGASRRAAAGAAAGRREFRCPGSTISATPKAARRPLPSSEDATHHAVELRPCSDRWVWRKAQAHPDVWRAGRHPRHRPLADLEFRLVETLELDNLVVQAVGHGVGPDRHREPAPRARGLPSRTTSSG